MTDDRYSSALSEVSQVGIDLSFEVTDLARASHPNSIHVSTSGRHGESIAVRARSIGGGIVELENLCGWDVSIDGSSWWLGIVIAEGEIRALQKKIDALVGSNGPTRASVKQCSSLLEWKIDHAIPESIREVALEIPGVSEVWCIPPVLFSETGRQLFRSAEEMLALARNQDLTLGECAVVYETELLGWSKAQVEDEMRRRLSVMRESVLKGLDGSNVCMDLSSASASAIMSADQRGQLAVGGVMTRAAARAMACLHVCNSRGVVCAAPTGGSAGVIPGVLSTLMEEKGIGESLAVRSLFAAGTIGLVFAERATFAAETAGCQVEIGAAGAMAAAMVVEAVGGTARQAADAAAISLHNTMGMVCDPVGGGCEIPCHTRNAVAAANAFVCADLVLGGYQNLISLDDSIDASYAVGRALPTELRCTARGGIAITPSAKELVSSRS
jgi:L-serine dehydratase